MSGDYREGKVGRRGYGAAERVSRVERDATCGIIRVGGSVNGSRSDRVSSEQEENPD